MGGGGNREGGNRAFTVSPKRLSRIEEGMRKCLKA